MTRTAVLVHASSSPVSDTSLWHLSQRILAAGPSLTEAESVSKIRVICTTGRQRRGEFASWPGELGSERPTTAIRCGGFAVKAVSMFWLSPTAP